MFTKLKTELEIFQLQFDKSFKVSESALTSSVTNTVRSLVDRVNLLSIGINHTVDTLKTETRELLQTECVHYVNTSIRDVMEIIETSISTLRQTVLTSIGSLEASVKELTEDTIPGTITDIDNRMHTLSTQFDMYVTMVYDIERYLQGNVSDMKNESKVMQLEYRIDINHQLSTLNSTLYEYIDSAHMSTEQKLFTLAG